MRVLIAPNAFKGTIPAQEAGEIIASFLSKISFKIDSRIIPIADGGDGTCELLSRALGLEQISIMTLNPLGRPLGSVFGWDSNAQTAYIDVSTASGIADLDEKTKNPTITSSFGTGLLIQKAIAIGAKKIILGLGGSATIDLGIGLLMALGISFLDQKGRLIPAFSPDFMNLVRHIQRPPQLSNISFTCLCDVRNVFFGPDGAIPVFGIQKGLKKDDFDSFEKICENQVTLLFSKVKKDFVDKEGFGAAGGIALGLSAFFSTEIKFGATYFFELIHMKTQVKWADIVITGEGRYDQQSNSGKACFELLELVKKEGKKIILITSGHEANHAGFDDVLVLPDLDFLAQNYKTKARENLLRLLESHLNF